MHSFFVAVLLAKLAASLPAIEPGMNETLYKRVPPMSFACDNIPDVCTSMCWGAYCTEPAFGATLYFDNPTESKKSDRRTSAGCEPRPNRCSVNHEPPYGSTGYNCDEYPFASTSDADKGGQTNRCVPKSQNSDAPGVRYCDAYADRHNRCIPDDNTYKGHHPDVQPPADHAKRDLIIKPRGGLCRIKRGMDVSFAEDLEPGTPIAHARARTAGPLEKRADCDTGDGDEWDNEPDALSVRRSKVGLSGMPDFEIIDDEIAYKME